MVTGVAALINIDIKIKLKYKIGEFVVYPAHGVGKIVALEEQEIAGARLELFVIDFEKDKMRLRVPLNKCDSVGMRKLSSDKTMREAMETLVWSAAPVPAPLQALPLVLGREAALGARQPRPFMRLGQAEPLKQGHRGQPRPSTKVHYTAEPCCAS